MSPSSPSSNGTPRPLEGYRGIVLTQVWAGPFATELLAFLGAEVIQIETRQRADPMRGGSWDAELPEGLRDRPNTKHAWNTWRYNSVNLNKKSVTLNLAKPKGIELFKALVKHADFFAENYAPRVMHNFGLEYEDLKKVKPDLVCVNIGGFGHSGRYWNTLATGGQIEPMSGMTEQIGYEGGPPTGSGELFCDPVAGVHAATAILLGLRYRNRTGKGQQIDVSMQEANANFIGDALMEYSLNRTVRRRLGNHHVTLAPHSIYPCRNDQWLAVAV